MKSILAYLYLVLAFSSGCSRSGSPGNDRVDGSGAFTMTNSTDTVFWGQAQDSETNYIRFVLLLPESAQFSTGSSSRGGANYEYCRLTTKRDGHIWVIDSSGTNVLRLSDLTANTATNLDLNASRLWKISDDKDFLPLNKIDPQVMDKVLHESEAGFKSIQAMRNHN